MKKATLYSRTSIFVFSVLLSGVAGALMLGYNLKKAGKNRFYFPLVFFTLLTNIILLLIIRNLYRPQRRLWTLNKTIGWGWDINDFIWWIGGIYQFFLPNILIGFILVSYVWKKQLSEFQTYENKRPWIPFVITVLFYIGLLITFLIISY